MGSVIASNVPDGLLKPSIKLEAIQLRLTGLLYILWVSVHCSVVGLWHTTVAEYVCSCISLVIMQVLVYQ